LWIALAGTDHVSAAAGWPQWGAGPAHENSSAAVGQPLDFTLGDVIYDPFAPAEQEAAGDDLRVHYQAPIVEGADVFMTFKTGAFTDRATWESQIWNVKRLTWTGDHLGEVWTMATDWKPEPFALAVWEPVFHPALHGQTVFAPGFGGSLLRFRRSDGMNLGRVNPFGETLDPEIFVSGPLTIDGDGSVFYNAIKLDTSTATSAVYSDVLGAWLVRVTPEGVSSTVAFSTLVPDAPAGADNCLGQFTSLQLPWPPSTDAVPPSAPCGSQRPGLNVAPAVAADGTIYTVSRAHRNDRYGYLVAVNADLTPKWHASLRDRFNDGCGVLIASDGSEFGCRVGANVGVDPATNRPGAGRVMEQASSSPTVAPDGSVLYGAYTSYNFGAGHLMKFSSAGDYVGSYPFGWDVTPTIYRHDGGYSILLKENHYAPADPEEYRITQLDASLQVEWSFKATNTQSCTRQPDGSLQCVSDHPDGFEWCVNAAAVDANGTVYANSEDGGLYAIAQGGTQVGHRFLQLALGAAYTPLAIGDDGRIYTQNFGHLFVVGAAPDPIFADGFD
jgi:outer membrane protein assembly factor BamB